MTVIQQLVSLRKTSWHQIMFTTLESKRNVLIALEKKDDLVCVHT